MRFGASGGGTVALTRITPPHSRRVFTTAGEPGHVNLTGEGSFYQPLDPGFHRVTVVATARGTAHVATNSSAKERYISENFDADSAATVEVTVPPGETHYLNVWLNNTGSVRVLMEHLATP